MTSGWLPILLAASAPAPPVAPPRAAFPDTPPPIVSVPISPAQRRTCTPRRMEIRLTGETGLLWSGSLRVGCGSSSYRQTLSEAPEGICTSSSRVTGRTETSVNVTIIEASLYENDADRYQVSVGWTRPAAGSDCAQSGTRSAQISQSVELKPGKTQVLTGDAGLKLELKRYD